MGKTKIIKKQEADTKEAAAPKQTTAGKTTGKFSRGTAHIQATYNNTIITMSDEKGNVLGWSSAGSLGFAGAKKATPFAAARVAEAVVEKTRKTGLQEITVMVSGVGSGRDSAIRALTNQGLQITYIKDVTPLPHNGPRPKKVRRV